MTIGQMPPWKIASGRGTSNMPDLLRFATAGSVDDGKSSLIGRLLYDSKSILEDQMLSIERASRQRGNAGLELALLTDGLRAEREQNITIDVAYRYFSTPNRKFIVADTPGHLQYTRNMVTGTSTADLSVILIDVRKGVLEQSKRHAAISSLLGVKHLVVAVNKMDLVDFSHRTFEQIEAEFREFCRRLGVEDVHFVPVSAPLGDNVVGRSKNTPWYQGPSLLELLESIQIDQRATSGFRLPVQVVIRPHQDFRGFAGRVESGSIRVGDEIEVAASGKRSRVASLNIAGEPAREARQGQAIVLQMEDDVDASRGDLFFSPIEPPIESDRIESLVCWLHETPLQVGRRYILLQGTRRVSAIVEAVLHRVDVDTLEPHQAAELGVNDIGRLLIRAAKPLFFDPYDESPATGSFVLVDPGTNATVGAGMIQHAASNEEATLRIGRVLAFGGRVQDAFELAEALRRFGRPVLVLESQAFALEATTQGFDVLFTTPIEGAFTVSGPEALDQALNYLEEKL